MIFVEDFQAKAQQAGETHLQDRKTAAVEMVRKSFEDLAEILGGDVENHEKPIGALVKSLLADPGVKDKLMKSAQKKALQTFASELQAVLGATEEAVAAMAEPETHDAA